LSFSSTGADFCWRSSRRPSSRRYRGRIVEVKRDRTPFAPRLATGPVVHATLEEIAREGACRALQKAIEDEVAEYIEAHKHHLDESNRRLVVRNGGKPPRTVLTGVGPLEVNQPRVDDRREQAAGLFLRWQRT
jgi:hypothetical protein